MASTRQSTAARITEYALQKTVGEEVRRQVAISELAAAAERFERKALDGRYNMAKDLVAYYEEKGRSCRREIARLRGEDQAEPEVAKSRLVAISSTPAR
jgi:hypothetical protein